MNNEQNKMNNEPNKPIEAQELTEKELEGIVGGEKDFSLQKKFRFMGELTLAYAE